MKYRCPKCNETDLFVQVDVVYRYDGENNILVQVASKPDRVIPADAYTVCTNDECEYSGSFHAFEVLEEEPKPESEITPLMVATAICQVDARAGLEHGKHRQSVEKRAANLVRDHKYGPFIEAGDPKGWAEPGDSDKVACTIYLEARGGDTWDCEQPLAYYEDGMEKSMEASDLLPGGAFIEFVNPAVALVWKG